MLNTVRILLSKVSHMLKRKNLRRRRTYQRSKYTRQRSLSTIRWGSLHKRAIDRLALELRSGEGLICWFHSGVGWQDRLPVISYGAKVQVKKECAIYANGRQYRPDLTIRCDRTGKLLLLIEVWETHAVGERKRRAFAESLLPWIEVRPKQVLSRFRNKPLPVLDWGGLTLGPPTQYSLFERPRSLTLTPKETIEEITASWKHLLGSRFALSLLGGKRST